MKTAFRHALRGLGLLALFSLSAAAGAHEVDCKGRAGIDLARCERHALVAERCGKITGEAHYACDREALLAMPLDCKPFSGAEAAQCQAELAAFKVCQPKPGVEFMRCVRQEAKASPMGGNSAAAAPAAAPASGAKPAP